MYFLPLLTALLVFLAFPSTVLSVAAGALVYAYLYFAGESVPAGKRAITRGQLAYRMLSVKLLTLNGEMSDDTYKVHALLTPDEPETSELRGSLRDAAFTTGDGWKHWAREVRKIYQHDPLKVLDRYQMLIVQLKASTTGITHDSQDRLIEIGKMWGVGPAKAREFLAEMETDPSPRMAAW